MASFAICAQVGSLPAIWVRYSMIWEVSDSYSPSSWGIWRSVIDSYRPLALYLNLELFAKMLCSSLSFPVFRNFVCFYLIYLFFSVGRLRFSFIFGYGFRFLDYATLGVAPPGRYRCFLLYVFLFENTVCLYTPRFYRRRIGYVANPCLFVIFNFYYATSKKMPIALLFAPNI